DLKMLEGNLAEAISFDLAEIAPGQVVERARAIGDAPMRHDAVGIELERLVKALHALFLVEAEAPVQAEIEPALRLSGRGPDLSGMGAEIETVHGGSLLQPATLFRRQIVRQPCSRGLPLRRGWKRPLDPFGAIAALGSGVESGLGHEATVFHCLGAVGAGMRH